MIIRRAEQRGKGQIPWLKSFHTFSFADYHDPRWTHFRHLRVLNDDVIAAGKGFGMHPHRDMEILTYVISGSLEHRDSMGNGSIIGAGNVQYMSAGSGVEHSEWNASKTDPVHLLQMWVIPQERSAIPRYSEKNLANGEKNAWQLVASPDGRNNSIEIRQDVLLFLAELGVGKELNYFIAETRSVWMHVATGEITLNELTLKAGDAVGLTEVALIKVQASADSKVLLYDLS